MSPAPDDLASLKDDMIAFIEGHGMRRFPGYVDYEEVQSVVVEGRRQSRQLEGFCGTGQGRRRALPDHGLLDAAAAKNSTR